MTFRVGQKVTMVRPWRTGPSLYNEIFTVFGEVYTIRETLLVGGKHEALRFFEIVNTPNSYQGYGLLEQPFPANNFRPIVENKSSISFTQGADPSTDKLDNRRKSSKKIGENV